MERVSITTNHPLFDECWMVYCEAFPSVERRALEYQRETMLREEYHFEAIIESGLLIGILGWWEFDDVRYIEHLATTARVRNGGYGSKILRTFIDESSKPIILEVEHPEDDLTTRRIGFYERIGFHLSDLPYCHPSYDKECPEFVSLRIMSHPTPISAEWLHHFTDDYFPAIHFDHFRERR